ncbi:DNA helicase Rep [Buchnera aphidicola]|uniref:DNA helicase Rep n=1 Tax=Buchnera aphidicola TaxID=9 RepID=UPI00346451B1
MSLNFSQNQAIRFTQGPCLILAGAGSGKTKVIINKIIYLIDKCGYKTNDIAAVTFTNKAAQEMKHRISKYISTKELNKIIISTFHALGMKIIRSELNILGIKSNFSLFDEYDQMIILKEISVKKLKNDKFLLKKLFLFISNCKNKLLDSKQVLKIAKSNLEKTFAECYKKYENYLKSCNILDFDDLIFLPTLLLKKNKSVRLRWQKKIRYLLVDEYQDTNEIQYELIKLLNNHNSNFTLVGDDDQSIYSWRGARPQNILCLKEDFPTLQIIKMEHNYRSSKRILKAANILISNNPHILKKNLFSELENGSKIKILITENEEEEAKKVIKKIVFHRLSNHTGYKDYAILYRSNYQSRILEKILIQNKVPYHISSDNSFLSRPEIKNLIAYLRFIINPDDDITFLRIINTPPRKIGLITIKKLSLFAKQKNKSLFNSSFDVEIKKFLTKNTLKNLQNFTIWIKDLINMIEKDSFFILDKIIIDIKYKEWLKNSSTDLKIINCKIKNVDTLIKWIKQMLIGNKIEKPLDLSKVIEKFALRDIIDNKDNDTHIDKIKLMTLHGSKGLEFPFVFIIGMEEGILPHHSTINDNVEEERRLAYVGITRAKKELFFSYCEKRYQYGTVLYPQPSRFLFELPEKDILWEKRNKNNFYNCKISNPYSKIIALKKILKNKM